jgi:hypothetical protein
MSSLFVSAARSTEWKSHIWSFARDAATLYRWTYTLAVSAVRRRSGCGAATMDRNMTSRSEPWKSAASPHRRSRAVHSSGETRSSNLFSIAFACPVPNNEMTPKVSPSYAGSARHFSIWSTTASTSGGLVRLADDPRSYPSCTKTVRIGSSRSAPNWRTGISRTPSGS